MTSSPVPSRARIVRAYLVLPHAVPVLVVMATTLGCALLVPDGPPGLRDVTFVLVAMFGGQLAIGAVNEIVDAADDSIAKPDKPIPSGLVPIRHALAIAVVGIAAMLGASIALGFASALFCVVGTGAGLAYDLGFKRTSLSWLPYFVALPLLPIWVWTALDSFDVRLLWLYPLGGAAVVGVHLAQSLPDIAGDRQTGTHTLATRLGERRALVACWSAILSAPLLAGGVAAAVVERPAIVWIAAVSEVVIVTAHVLTYRVRPKLAISTCFPVVAMSAATMGLAWVLALR